MVVIENRQRVRLVALDRPEKLNAFDAGLFSACGDALEEAARAAAEEGGLSDARLTPQLIDLLKKTFRGVHLLAYLKREELEELDRLEDFESAAEDARTVQGETLGLDDEPAES